MASTSSTPTRWVMVDDTSHDYEYTGTWFQARRSQYSLGNFGPPFQSTLQGINSNGTIKYTYQGSRVVVYGTVSTVQVDFNGFLDTDWSCLVDDVAIEKNEPSVAPENNWILCSGDALSEAFHTVTINAIVRNQKTFWFDRIQYVPSPGADLSNTTVLVDAYDPAVNLSSGWQTLDGIGYMTQQNGAKLTLDFIGSSLSWVSVIPSDQPRGSASASYSIDGGTPTSFFLPGLQPTDLAQYNKILFQTPQLGQSLHRLEVTHEGNSSVTPLTIDYFIVQNATIPSTTSSSSGAQLSTFSGSNSAVSADVVSSSAKKTPVGAIVGAVVGASVVTILILLFLLFRCRENRRKEREARAGETLNMASIRPFTDPPPVVASYRTQLQQAKSTSTTASPTAENSTTSLPMSAKERRCRGSISRTDERSVSAGSSRILRHQDSGVRLPAPEEEREPVVELPPVYTPA